MYVSSILVIALNLNSTNFKIVNDVRKKNQVLFII